VRVFSLLVSFLVSGFSLAAPYADPKQVGLWSRMDEFIAARGVQRAAAPRELKRAAPDAGLEKLLDGFLDAHPNTGLLVLKGDTILAERYQYERTDRHRFASASVAKTVLGMLVGIALHEKKISSLDDRVGQYVGDLVGHPYGDATIRELLTMSSGIAFSETALSGRDRLNLVRNTIRQRTEGGVEAVLQFDQRDSPGGMRFNYASADSQVLGLVLRAAVREPLANYLSDKIWRPMGAEAHAMWLLDKAGHEASYCCLNAVLRDYARFGMLLANYGALDGKQIIPAEWVKAATTPEAPHLAVGTATPNNGYGYQTWVLGRRPRESGDPVSELRFAALGIHGQAIFVDPVTKLVVVHTAVWADPYDRAERGAQFKLLAAIHAKLESQ
jgi:CubicO group peptidase (beta-lactamase class C family)